MLIETYNTTDTSNTVNKSITLNRDMDINFKGDVSIMNPTIILKYDTPLDFNYIYIPVFKRYYFITNISIFPNKVYRLDLECDLLMSYKDDILQAKANIKRQVNHNNYFNSNYNSEVRKEVDIYNSNVTLIDDKTTILVTIGGI